MIPALTVTDARTAELLLSAVANDWDQHVKHGAESEDSERFALLLSIAVQAAQLGVDHTRYMRDHVVRIVDAELRTATPFVPQH